MAIPHEKTTGHPQVVTLSLGVAWAGNQDRKKGADTALIVPADQAFYRAKANGRNRVEPG
ncbi:MAG: diguanylate cyclase [Desulfobacterium sp.]|nr:diguanylate cyclase [Desulfobacterium sp.]